MTTPGPVIRITRAKPAAAVVLVAGAANIRCADVFVAKVWVYVVAGVTRINVRLADVFVAKISVHAERH